MSAGEKLDVFVPHFDSNRQTGLAARFDKERFRVEVEICYCSALGDCWKLVAPALLPARTDEVGRCRAQWGAFKQ